MATGKGPARSGERERFWRRIVARQPSGGVSIREWCAQHQVSEPSFYAWRRELARRDAQRRGAHPSVSRAELVELAWESAPQSSANAPAIQIIVADLRVTVGPGFDGETLGRLLGLLRSMAVEATAAC